MKAEISEGDRQGRLSVYAHGNSGDDFNWSRWCSFSELEAIHAALTEWKAKREAKPVEPKWRAWKDASEVPANAAWLRSRVCREGERFAIASVLNYPMPMAANVATREAPIRADELLDLWEWSPDGVSWHRCGIAE